MQGIEAGAAVLDLGAGYGRVGSALEAMNPSAEIVSLEINPELVLRGVESAKSLNFTYGDVKEIPFPDQSFDAVSAVNVFHEVASSNELGTRLEEFDQAINEVSRVLRLGGQLIMFDGAMPLEGNSAVLVRSHTARAEALLRKFASEYTARKPDIIFDYPGYAVTDVSTLATLLTKFDYLVEDEPWEGERKQLYPFATIPEITNAMARNDLLTTSVTHPTPDVRPGLKALLENYFVSDAISGIAFDQDIFPYCQAMIKATKVS